jgi:hypothetical protein
MAFESVEYTRKETQTWTFTGAAPTTSGDFLIYPATWTASGEGSSHRAQGSNLLNAQWTVTVPAQPVQLAVFVRASDGKLIIRQWSPRLSIPAAVKGTRRVSVNATQPASPSNVSVAASEWDFGWIVDNPDSLQLRGSKPIDADLLPAEFSAAQAPHAATATWEFTRGATPATVAGVQKRPATPPATSSRGPQGEAPSGRVASTPVSTPTMSASLPTDTSVPTASPAPAAPPTATIAGPGPAPSTRTRSTDGSLATTPGWTTEATDPLTLRYNTMVQAIHELFARLIAQERAQLGGDGQDVRATIGSSPSPDVVASEKKRKEIEQRVETMTKFEAKILEELAKTREQVNSPAQMKTLEDRYQALVQSIVDAFPSPTPPAPTSVR